MGLISDTIKKSGGKDQYTGVSTGMNPNLDETIALMNAYKSDTPVSLAGLNAGKLVGDPTGEPVNVGASLASRLNNSDVGYGVTPMDLAVRGLDVQGITDEELFAIGQAKKKAQQGDMVDQLLKSGPMEASQVPERDLYKEALWGNKGRVPGS